ncbi:MAG: hypothetical protein WC700_21030 [Gemmatimonadaceae bacterium]
MRRRGMLRASLPPLRGPHVALAPPRRAAGRCTRWGSGTTPVTTTAASARQQPSPAAVARHAPPAMQASAAQSAAAASAASDPLLARKAGVGAAGADAGGAASGRGRVRHDYAALATAGRSVTGKAATVPSATSGYSALRGEGL